MSHHLIICNAIFKHYLIQINEKIHPFFQNNAIITLSKLQHKRNIMTKVCIIKDKTDENIRKPFVAIYKSSVAARAKVLQLQSKLKETTRELITLEMISVTDFDVNKSSIYVLYDKTDANFKKPFMAMYSDYSNASVALDALRAKVPPYAQKLIFMRNEKVS